jgi:hypothetical protein
VHADRLGLGGYVWLEKTQFQFAVGVEVGAGFEASPECRVWSVRVHAGIGFFEIFLLGLFGFEFKSRVGNWDINK